MRYLLMICTDEQWYAGLSQEQLGEFMAQYSAWTEEVGQRGALQGGERLRPTTDATTVRVRDGETITSDGPFAETKEQIAGFDILECADLDEAMEVAAKHPVAGFGALEPRPFAEE